MNVLVVGSGGREHAIANKLAQSYIVENVIVAPGNAGIHLSHEKIKCINVDAKNISGLLELADTQNILLTVVGPENALTEGIVDAFSENNRLIVGPTKKAAYLEASKAFGKKIMEQGQVPTAHYKEFFNSKEALAFLENTFPNKSVVKCDGLAAGKGVIVCQTNEEAKKAVLDLMENRILGENVSSIVIEEFLEGRELSAFALCDGEDFVFLGSACDHKRLFDGDQGPNTGGMGAYSPCEFLTKEDILFIKNEIFKKTLKAMNEYGYSFSGFLFAGLMKTDQGIKVIEFNVRMGDPETQALFPLINEDIVPWLMAVANRELALLKKVQQRSELQLSTMCAVHVVVAAKGYPGISGEKIQSGDRITFYPEFNLSPLENLYYAGVKENDQKELITSGGRVLGVTSLAETYTYARLKTYEHLDKIILKDRQYRSDIAKGLI
jgi:phosphoribosylamine--glycine ligase